MQGRFGAGPWHAFDYAMVQAMDKGLPIIDFAGASDEALARQLDSAFSDIGFCYFRGIGVDPAAGRRRVRGVAALPRPAARRQGGDRDEPLPSRLHGAQDLDHRDLVGGARDAAERFRIVHADARGAHPTIRATAGRSTGRTCGPTCRASASRSRPTSRPCTPFACACCRPMALGARPAARLVRAALRASPRRSCACCTIRRKPSTRPTTPSARRRTPTTASSPSCARTSRAGSRCGARDGTWLAAPPIDGTWVVNVADMLSRWTNGRWQSTPHRVKNLSGGDRYSCPYFFDMAMDSIVEVLPTCQPAKHPRRALRRLPDGAARQELRLSQAAGRLMRTARRLRPGLRLRRRARRARRVAHRAAGRDRGAAGRQRRRQVDHGAHDRGRAHARRRAPSASPASR